MSTGCRRSSIWYNRILWSTRFKLIAELWDVDEGDYQAGHFPGRWAEWNSKYRYNVQRLLAR